MSSSQFTSHYQKLPGSIQNLILRIIQDIHPDEIILFGSRARGDNRENSDFDIVIKALSIPSDKWTRLQLAIDEEPITLFSVDLIDFSRLSGEYKKRILSEGLTLYVH